MSICYMYDESDIEHFVWIKNLSRLVSSQISRKEHKKFFCDRYVYLLKLRKYFNVFIFMVFNK